MLRKRLLLAGAVCLGFMCVTPGWAQVNGAIYTTNFDGSKVNGNIYQSKDAVYLSGGPQNKNDAGLSPAPGYYYFQVTDPSGAVLLSTDAITCRVVFVNGQGRVDGIPGTASSDPTAGGFGTSGCYHLNGTTNDSNGGLPVQLVPYDDTTNPGGEYKAWLTPVNLYTPGSGTFGFIDSSSKTDNFKVKKAGDAYVVVCKFNDLNGNGVQDSPEPLISSWSITATGVDAGSPTATGQDGCATYTISSFPNNNTQTVTLAEVLQNGYTQTAPGNGTYDANGSLIATGPTTVSGASPNNPPVLGSYGGVITVVIGPDQTVMAPGFGNFQFSALVNLSVSKTVFPTYTAQWSIAKTVNGSTEIDTSGTATGNYSVVVTLTGETKIQDTGVITINNSNPIQFLGVNVTDGDTIQGNCAITDTMKGQNETVPAADSSGKAGVLTLPYTCTYATVPTTVGIDTATASYVLPGSPAGSSPTQTSNLPINVDFSTATVTNATVNVTDTLKGSLGSVTLSPALPTPSLSSTAGTVTGSQATFAYSVSLNGKPGYCTDNPNTATFTAADDATVTLSDTKHVKVCVGADLTVAKVASTSFTRTYNWTDGKSASFNSRAEPSGSTIQESGATATLSYSVTVSETGFTDSAWTVSGMITVTNPNTWEDFSGVTLADSLGTGCTITPSTLTVAHSSFATATYSCPVTSAASGTNTATASWTGYSTPDSSAKGQYGFSFPTTPAFRVNKTVTVTDTYKGILGTLTATDTTPYTTQTWIYTRTVTVPAGSCAPVNNTATATAGTAPSPTLQLSSTVNLTVCNTNTGALTMGFWKNPNGQAIIANYCGGTSGTTLVTYLAGFNPFKDDTVACTKEAAYVSTIIGAATCSSSTNTCNTMLRAQMLATALDVYFSTSTLGGNRIGAYNGLAGNTPALGGIAIDLSHVCAMLDGSTSSTCSGVSEDVRPEFGIATSCTGTTVSQMLSYSNFPSATNGSPVATTTTGASWYLQNKGKQVPAKDAFDNFNNVIANIAPTSCTSTF